ncbi:MAG TPA: D-alanine--D-alanine ligase family protein [Acidimicrobiales bacterium]|nr:D-alanine--D-alanine ligase family protein [Acidimicrobiales bacterium]
MRLVLLFGGRSAEHDVSCVTGAHVLAAADPDRYDIVPVGITPGGRWVRAEADPDRLRAEGPEVQPADVLGQPDTIAFPVLHGPFGEDGTAQGLLEMMGVPYVGAGVLGSALCMDKAMAKQAAAASGLPQVRHLAFRDIDLEGDFDGAVRRAAADLGLPVFVKPANLGSSVGVTRATDVDELSTAVKLALDYDEWVVVEEAVTAREIECGLLGYGRLRASVPGEIRPSHDFYDYEDKYADGAAELLVPAPLPPEVADEVQRLAVEAADALRVDGMARVDFFYEELGRGLLLNEVNTIPGFTPISMYPRMWAATGVPYRRLIDTLVDAGLARHRNRAERYGRSR